MVLKRSKGSKNIVFLTSRVSKKFRHISLPFVWILSSISSCSVTLYWTIAQHYHDMSTLLERPKWRRDRLSGNQLVITACAVMVISYLGVNCPSALSALCTHRIYCSKQILLHTSYNGRAMITTVNSSKECSHILSSCPPYWWSVIRNTSGVWYMAGLW